MVKYHTIIKYNRETKTSIIENGMITNNRLILLDSILLFFTTFTILMWINFRNQLKSSFKPCWWIWLILTGTGLGLAVSCKWVGLFTIATIGIDVLKELWRLWGDLTVSRVREKINNKSLITYIISISSVLLLNIVLLVLFVYS